MLERAVEYFGCQSNEVQEFVDVLDEFNGNTLTGALCLHGDHRYGALLITAVNGKETKPQLIRCTPKLHYPFGKDDELERHYNWPAVIQHARIYEKLDGTNICAYSYADAMGERYVTYKTRLTPVLKAGRHGDFLGMWRRMIEKYPKLRNPMHVLCGEFALSFEMYGYQNPVLVHYDVDLDVRELFAIRQSDASIWPADKVQEKTNVPTPTMYEAGSGESLTAAYERMRLEAEAKNTKTEDGYIIGTEGFVFYTYDGARWQMWKCKPEMIEDLHWAKGGISRAAIITTAKNALENVSVDELTAEVVNKLLAEEFSNEQIGLSAARVADAIEEVRTYYARCEKVRDLYSRCPDTSSKREVMRYMSKFFERGQMSTVYNTMRTMGLVNEGG
jgi:hypothetical protein